MCQIITMYNANMRPIYMYIAFVVLILAVWIFIFAYFDNTNLEESALPSSSIVQSEFALISIADAVVRAEIADTDQKRIKGLGARAEIAEDEGMFFVFQEAGFHQFWMKDMLFSLDFIWINENFTIVDITENVAPDTFPKKLIPQFPVQYVLEVPAGFVKRHNIQKGSFVNVTPTY